ncbi:SPOR domain-containing protein [Sphingomonas sp.]|uniref:SPOR domain-containing protein n=1 Tax=Sphingomonas sp. TaxID=28214 RepID=UPI0025DC8F8E|nr:SPOR domain-containing protein [Sphingomonas sp.]
MKFVPLLVLGAAVAALTVFPAFADLKTGDTAWQRGDYPAAVAQWRPLAIAGDPEAQLHMGQAYQLGRGVPVDLKLAQDWFRRAAQQGSEDGKDSYGLVLFQTGKRAEALPYLEDAAGRGNPRAQYIVGTALFNGDMIAKDWPRAYAMMTRASAAGIPAARTSLGQMDRFIPLDQRTRGLALARAFDDHAKQTNLPKPLVAEPAPVEAPKSTMPVPNTPKTIAAKPAPPKAIPTKPTAPPPAPASGGNWRVQLGAFADAATVRALWPSLRSRIPALTPYRAFAVKAGPLTRLQAGPLVSRAAADQLCAALRRAKQPCTPVVPAP